MRQNRSLNSVPRHRGRPRSGGATNASLEISGPALLATPCRLTNEDALRVAFATNDLRHICRAVDAVIVSGGIAKVAQHAELDRATIYRAFRRENGPALDTMFKVLHVLGLRLIVESKPTLSSERPRLDMKTTARSLTAAFKTGDLDLAVEALSDTLRSQDNVSELARTTVLSRENLYRAFSLPRIPRFRTVLNFLNAIGLQFAIERQPIES